MPQTSFFGADDPTPADALPTVSTGLSWYDVQRQRLRKFAFQYANDPPIPVTTLRSQGEPDVTDPAVVATREGFTQLRRNLPVMDQYAEYSGDPDILGKVKEVALAWVRTNQPDGKPINESNFEWLLRVLKRRYDDFTAAEQADIDAWVQALRAAKEAAAAGGFQEQTTEGEGTVEHGNWWTHHYKILLQVYDLQGDTAAFDALLAEIDGCASRNFPYGNAEITYPAEGEDYDPALHDMPRAATDPGESIDYIRRDALHYQVYDLMPWVEIALLAGGARYQSLIENGWAFFLDRLLAPEKHYEFANTSDPFDAERWAASHPEYLAPNAMFKPQRACGLVLAFMHWRKVLDPGYVEDSRHVALACRAVPEVATYWAAWFRWALGYGHA